jgi:hypothetical protein
MYTYQINWRTFTPTPEGIVRISATFTPNGASQAFSVDDDAWAWFVEKTLAWMQAPDECSGEGLHGFCRVACDSHRDRWAPAEEVYKWELALSELRLFLVGKGWDSLPVTPPERPRYLRILKGVLAVMAFAAGDTDPIEIRVERGLPA